MKFNITIFLVLGLVFLAACTQSTTVDDNAVMEKTDDEIIDNTMPVPTGDPVDEMEVIKTFQLDGGMFWFEMNGERAPVIRVNEGDTVRIELTSVDGLHDWVVDEFSAATEKVRPENGMTYVEFVADQKGTFEYYCSVGSHRANGMIGTLIVE